MSEPTTTAEVDVVWNDQTPLEVEFEDWFRGAVADVPGLATETYNALRRSADEFKARLRLKG